MFTRTSSRPRLAALFLILLAPACSSGGDLGPDDQAAVASLTIVPDRLVLAVGGQGTLTAEVRDADAALMPNARVSWSSLAPGVASVTGAGNVRGVTVGIAQIVAAAGGEEDTVEVLVVDELTLEVVPSAATVKVGATVPFSVVARNGSGQQVAAPAVTWTAASPAVATIDDAGVATGVAPGQTAITAAAGAIVSEPATLTVTDDQAQACEGIASVSSFKGSLDYQFAVFGTTEGGFQVDADHSAKLTATLTRVVPGGPIFETWVGDLEGGATITERQSGNDNETAKMDGAGPIVQPPGGVARSVMTLIVNLTTCTYALYVNPFLHVIRTESYGAVTESDVQVSLLQIGRATSLGSWRSLGISDPEASVDGHSVVWAALNPDRDAFSALGFSAALYQQSGGEPPVGEAAVSYVLLPE
jgi:hypothetical protein